MVGSLVGTAFNIGTSIFGGIAASRAMKKIKKDLQDQRKENEAWYNRRYNEDSTQRADAQRILNKTEESIRNRNRAAAGSQAVIGGTQESLAATKAANNEALAEAASRIAVAGDSRKDQIEQQYRAKDSNLRAQLNNLEANKANTIAQAVKGAGSAASNLVNAFEKRD